MLQEEKKVANITTPESKELPAQDFLRLGTFKIAWVSHNMSLELSSKDVLDSGVEIIVNPANKYLSNDDGDGSEISKAAGPKMDLECKERI